MFLNLLSRIWNKKDMKEINVKTLPSQGYFYPENIKIYFEKGTIDDQVIFHYGINNSNIFGIVDTVKNILFKRLVIFPHNFEFDRIAAIDIFFLFIEFVKFTTGKPIMFSDIEFGSTNFLYFDFNQYIENYDSERREFNFNGWRFKLPSIGIESSLARFSYEISIRGKTDEYQDRNYNLIYFLGNRTSIDYKGMINLIETYEDLPDENKKEVNDIVGKFDKTGMYFLIEMGKKSTRINPHQLKEIWPVDE